LIKQGKILGQRAEIARTGMGVGVRPERPSRFSTPEALKRAHLSAKSSASSEWCERADIHEILSISESPKKRESNSMLDADPDASMKRCRWQGELVITLILR